MAMHVDTSGARRKIDKSIDAARDAARVAQKASTLRLQKELKRRSPVRTGKMKRNILAVKLTKKWAVVIPKSRFRGQFFYPRMFYKLFRRITKRVQSVIKQVAKRAFTKAFNSRTR